MKNIPPISPKGDKQPINLDLSSAKDVACDNCGNYTFQEVALLKHLSAIQSPTGKAGYVPIPVFACNACGFVNADFLPPFMRTNSNNKADDSKENALKQTDLQVIKD